jgi:hypothetical protein
MPALQVGVYEPILAISSLTTCRKINYDRLMTIFLQWRSICDQVPPGHALGLRFGWTVRPDLWVLHSSPLSVTGSCHPLFLMRILREGQKWLPNDISISKCKK